MDIFLESADGFVGFAIEHDVVDTLLPVTIRPRYAQSLLDLALGEDDKLFTDLDAGECCVDDGGVGIVADISSAAPQGPHGSRCDA